MVLLEENDGSAKAALHIDQSVVTTPLDPPPSYEGTESTHPPAPVNTASPSAQALAGLKAKPTNYVRIKRDNNPINGFFTIDPSMTVPAALLPPLEDGEQEEDRKNFKVDSEHSGINVDVTLLSIPADRDLKAGKRTTLNARSHYSSVEVTLRKVNTTPSGVHPPFRLNAKSSNSSVKILLPRSFRGLITARQKYGSIKLSNDILEHASVDNEQDLTRTTFLGDLDEFPENGEWVGDEVNVEAEYSGIKIYFGDDGELREAAKGNGGFMSRFFSGFG